MGILFQLILPITWKKICSKTIFHGQNASIGGTGYKEKRLHMGVEAEEYDVDIVDSNSSFSRLTVHFKELVSLGTCVFKL